MQKKKQKKIILLFGPTASGKSRLAADLAKELNLKSSRTSEITQKFNEFHKKGGIFNIAKNLFQVYEYTRVTLIEEFKSYKVNKSMNALTALIEIRDSWKSIS